MDSLMSLTSTYYAIIDIQKEESRLCYADSEKTKGQMAIYDKKPKIPKKWQEVKKVVKVRIEIVEE
jgi:tRNA A22 N-methylase